MKFPKIKYYILISILLLSLVGCAQEMAQVEPSPTPIQEESKVVSSTPIYTGVTILADGVVLAASACAGG
jgi:PBP1b-binding outer membrane lipoprotein LpoB